MFKKIINFFTSKIFLYILFFVTLIIFSIFFYLYAPLIAFDDIHIFGNIFARIGFIVIIWAVVFFYFLLKPLIEFIQSFKNEKKKIKKELRREVSKIFHKIKRNYNISINDAKSTWKRHLDLKETPLVMIIGNEGAGKSAIINYSNIEYPLSDSLQSYKKIHQPTNNFSLYISKNGALIDTEGNYFSQESFFNPNSTDEIPEDDCNKNKEFIIKQSVWKKFLSFLNKNTFHNKLNGAIVVIDTQAFFVNPKEYSNNIIRYLTKRINECEETLNIKLPIYIIFSKIDLIEGMSEYWKIFNDNITDNILGITIESQLNKQHIESSFKEISNSLLYSFMNRNKSFHSISDKNLAFLFLKQLDCLFSLATDFIIQADAQNKLKNKSYIRGVYFTSAYQENMPRNYLLDAICDKYEIKKPPAKSATKNNKKSYFVKPLLENLILRDSHLSGIIMRNVAIKISIAILFTCILSYGLSAYFVSKANKEIAQSDMHLNNIKTLLNQTKQYKYMSLNEKANLMLNLKAILKNYPNLFYGNNIKQYPMLDISYQGFIPAKSLYYAINKDVISNTIIKEMENIFKENNTQEMIVETMYMYMALFDENHFDKNLLSSWIIKNWKYFNKYKIPQDDFIASIEDISASNLSRTYSPDETKLDSIRSIIGQIPKQERIYILINFKNSLKKQQLYNIKDRVGSKFNTIFENAEQFFLINYDFTKNGLREFLGNLDANIQNAAKIDAWILNNSTQNNNIKELYLDIIDIYLNTYRQVWQDMLMALKPKKYTTKEGILNQLQILSNIENPLNTFISIVSDNTYLNDTLLLNYAYSLGLPSTDIKAKFAKISNHFQPYYDFAKTESFINSKISAINKTIESNQESSTQNNIKENIAMDVKNIYVKINDFTQDNTQDIKSKIDYILQGSNDDNDPFKKFGIDIATLPSDIAKYYNDVLLLSWKIIENNSRDLFNNAWRNEIYTQFINDISNFYPFNAYTNESVSLDKFKNFFGNQGKINAFYKQYLNNILTKKGNTYYINANYQKRVNISKEFIDFLNKASIISSIFDSNNNLKLSFYINCLDLSSDFSSLDISYNDKNLRYEHNIDEKIYIITEQFSTSTEFSFIANDYNQNPKYKKLYTGEWAWFKFLKDMHTTSNSINSINFNNNKKLYFDFKITPNKDELVRVLNVISNLKLPQDIM